MILSLGMLVWHSGTTNCLNLTLKIFEQINFQSVVKYWVCGQWILVQSNGPRLSIKATREGSGGRKAANPGICSAANWERRLSIRQRQELGGNTCPCVFLCFEKSNYCVDHILASCSGLLTWQLFHPSLCLLHLNGVISSAGYHQIEWVPGNSATLEGRWGGMPREI